MQNEPPKTRITGKHKTDKRSDSESPFQYLHPPRRRIQLMVKASKFEFHMLTRSRLERHLSDANPEIDQASITKALDEVHTIVRQCIGHVRMGWNKRPEQRREVRRALVRLRNELDKLAPFYEPRTDEYDERERILEIAKAETRILAEMPPDSDTEGLLFQAGWPEQLDALRCELMAGESTPARTVRIEEQFSSLSTALNDAERSLDAEPSGKGGTALYSNRWAILRLADIWHDATETSVMQTSAKYRGSFSQFAEFARTALQAAAHATGTKPGAKTGCMKTIQDMHRLGLLPDRVDAE